MKKAIIGGAAVAALAAALCVVLPDVQRYLKIRRM
ncbi:hypothetical protein EDD91_0822 [Streptomyces sp. KS 21]|nr:hypothetical protein EDD91_0822 [Streptomyces sp. KS 21]